MKNAGMTIPSLLFYEDGGCANACSLDKVTARYPLGQVSSLDIAEEFFELSMRALLSPHSQQVAGGYCKCSRA